MSKKLEKYIDEVVDNIRKDREVTNDLLKDAIGYLAKDESRHRDIGLVLSKYVETLQRSNEQLVKLAALIQKAENQSYAFNFSNEVMIEEYIRGRAATCAVLEDIRGKDLYTMMPAEISTSRIVKPSRHAAVRCSSVRMGKHVVVAC